jgi:hypothetical protein
VGYAGLAYVPGFLSWFNGYYCALWVVAVSAGGCFG